MGVTFWPTLYKQLAKTGIRAPLQSCCYL